MISLIYMMLLITFIVLVYISGRNNRINLWCVCAGILLSIGVVKEVFLYDLSPWMQQHFHLSPVLIQQIYSVLTWMLYVFAMSAVVIFSLNFAGFPSRYPRCYHIIQLLLLLSVIILSFIYPPLQFRYYQLHSYSFWICFSAYNLFLGTVFSILMIYAVRTAPNPVAKKQKLLISIIILPPLIYWLISIFVVHLFRISNLFKIWQANTVILLICIFLYLYIASKDGLMGLRLRLETFSWDSGMDAQDRNAELIAHMLKNYSVKLNWCLSNLKSQYSNRSEKYPPEFAIMERSITGIQNYCDRIKRYSRQMILIESWTPSIELYPLNGVKQIVGNNHLFYSLNPSVELFCDALFIRELFHNIIVNAVEALQDTGKPGTIRITDDFDISGKYRIHFYDTGSGMTDDQMQNIFRPYYTTKSTENNFGLGLPYCMKIMKGHNGTIDVNSSLQKGSEFILSFPAKRVRMRKE